MSQGFTSPLPVPLPAAKGGTGLTATPANGQLAVGNGTGYTLSTLTAGAGATITNGAGTITVAASIASQAEMETGTSNTVVVSPGRQQYHVSASKAWLYSLYSAGVPQLSASYNITSITDNGTGDATVVIATDFSSANYCIASALNLSNTSSLTYSPNIYSVTSGSYRLSIANSVGVPTDPFAFHTACFGDQA